MLAFRRAAPAFGRALGPALGLALALGLAGCVDAVPALEARARSAWSEVEAQCRRRADLVPALVEAVKGHAAQEREVLAEVVEARERAVEARADAATVADSQKFREYRQAQDRLSAALARLLVTVERYPELKSGAAFLALRSRLDDAENRIAVARRDYAEAARAYNAQIRTAPGRWIAAFLHPEAKPLETFAANAAEGPALARF